MFGLSSIDVIASLAVAGVIAMRYKRAKEDQESKKRMMMTSRDRALLEFDNDEDDLGVQPKPKSSSATSAISSASSMKLPSSNQATCVEIQSPLAPYSGRGVGGEGLRIPRSALIDRRD